MKRKAIILAALMALVAVPASGQVIRVITPGGGGSTGTCALCLESDGTGWPLTANTTLTDTGVDATMGGALTLTEDAANTLVVTSTTDKAMRFGDATNPYLASYVAGTSGGIQFGRNGIASTSKLYATNGGNTTLTSGGTAGFILLSPGTSTGYVAFGATSMATPTLYGSADALSKVTTTFRADFNNARDRDGSDLVLAGGVGGATNRAGGSVTIEPGTHTGSGTPGKVNVARLTLTDPGTKPTCEAAIRGQVWYDAGGAGAADTIEICVKDAGDAYAWAVIATP